MDKIEALVANLRSVTTAQVAGWIRDTASEAAAMIPKLMLGAMTLTAANMRLCEQLAESRSATKNVEGDRERLQALLKEARHQGLIYWEPVTARGTVAKSDMLARIDAALAHEPHDEAAH